MRAARAAPRSRRPAPPMWLLDRDAVEVPMEVVGELGSVAVGAGDVAAAPPTQHAETEHVRAGRLGDDAAVVTDVAAVVEHGQVDPAMVGTEAGGPDDRANSLCLQVDLGGRRRRRASRYEPFWRTDLAVGAGLRGR